MATSMPPEDTPRARGNVFFVAGDYAAAAKAYSEGIKLTVSLTSSDESEQAKLLANRAACHLHLGDPASAVVDCRDCLQLQPCNIKALFRLAKALPPDDEAAAPAIAAAVAFCEPHGPTPEMLDIYASIQRATAAAAPEPADKQGGLLLQLPEDASRVAAAHSWDDVVSAVQKGAALVVLRPGKYGTDSKLPLGRGRQAYTLLGVGSVELRPAPLRPSHAVWATESHPPVTITHVRLVGGGTAAAACVSGPGATLRLIDCRVQDYIEAGVLVCERAVAWMDRCSFVRCGKHAIEVREGGSLFASRLSIADCKQGITAYGGAQTVVLRDSCILRSKYEGVLLNGTYSNRPTEMQASIENATRPPSLSEAAKKVTDAAVRWGRQRGVQLEAKLLGCTIAGCQQFGVTVDSGASAIVQGCCVEDNDPHGIFIKGGSDVSIVACQILYTGIVSKSEWYMRQLAGMARRGPPNQNGIQVGINYGGTINVYGNAFGGREELAIVEEMKSINSAVVNQTARQLGLWSRPVIAGSNSFHERSDTQDSSARSKAASKAAGRSNNRPGAAGASGAAQLPSLEALGKRLPSWLLFLSAVEGGCQEAPASARHKLRRRAVAVPAAGLLQRTCHTFPQAAWAPTAHEFYAIGNTLGYDVTSGLPPYDITAAAATGAGCRGVGEARPVRVLLGACGDVRNLLATVAAVMPYTATAATAATTADGDAYSTADGGSAAGRRLAFTLNDGNISMLARDVVLLHMAAELSAQSAAVLAVWANHGLSAQHVSVLACSLRALAEKPWPAWLTAATALPYDIMHPYDKDTSSAAAATATEAEAPYRRVFAAWASCTMTLGELLRQRENLTVTATAREMAVQLSVEAIRASLGTSAAQQVIPAVVDYLKTGSLQVEDGSGGGKEGAGPLVAANPTFLLAPELQYTVYFSSSIFRAVPLGPGNTPTQRLLATLSPQLEATAAALRSGAISITLLHGDILTVMLSCAAVQPHAENTPAATCMHAAEPAAFDFIDCSNVADYVSLQSLVQAAVPLLARTPHARLRTESMVLYGNARRSDAALKPDAFAEGQLGGASLAAFQELLGVRLLGGKAVGGMKVAVRLDWAPAAAEAALDSSGSGDGGASGEGGGACRASWMTAPRLLMELLPVCKAFLAGSPCNGTAPAGAPLAVVHLLTLVAPRHAEALLQVLLRCDAALTGLAGMFKSELTLHVQLQAAAAGLRPWPAVRRLLYKAKPGWDFVAYNSKPLLLAVSCEALDRGVPVEAPNAAPGPVKQLLSGFAWDEDFGTAHLLLPESLLKMCGEWYVTLVALDNGSWGGGGDGGGGDSKVGAATPSCSRLLVVGVSTRLASLKSQEAMALVRWRPMPYGPLQVNLQMLDAVCIRASAAAEQQQQQQGQEQGWQGRAQVSPDGRSLTVDVLAPGPLPAEQTAAVVAGVEGGMFRVGVRPKHARGARGASVESSPGAEFVMQLPTGGRMYGKAEEIRLSRKLGLLSARVPVLAAE